VVTTTDLIYGKLAEKYRLVGDAHFMKTLKAVMTPEEGRYLLELATPKTPAEIAVTLKLDIKTTAAKLDNLARRGLLFRGQTQYLAWGDAHQLKARIGMSADENIPSNYLDIRRQDQRYIDSPFTEIHLWFKLYEMSGKPLIRVIPARKAIAATPEIRPQDVLWYEDMAAMLKHAGKIGVTVCNCRRIYKRCDKPVKNCLHFGRMVDYEVGRGGRMKEISVEQAIAISDEAEEAGLVHNTPGNNDSLSGVICNCCDDCCSTFEPALQSGRLNEVVAPSRFRAKVKEANCKGCQKCLKRCQFGAIEMLEINGSKKKLARVIDEKCLGCGVCVVSCQHQAMTFDLVRPPEFIPPKPDFGQPLLFTTL
jgi:ferredoxin